MRHDRKARLRTTSHNISFTTLNITAQLIHDTFPCRGVSLSVKLKRCLSSANVAGSHNRTNIYGHQGYPDKDLQPIKH